MPDIVVRDCSPSTEEAETGGRLGLAAEFQPRRLWKETTGDPRRRIAEVVLRTPHPHM